MSIDSFGGALGAYGAEFDPALVDQRIAETRARIETDEAGGAEFIVTDHLGHVTLPPDNDDAWEPPEVAQVTVGQVTTLREREHRSNAEVRESHIRQIAGGRPLIYRHWEELMEFPKPSRWQRLLALGHRAITVPLSDEIDRRNGRL